MSIQYKVTVGNSGGQSLNGVTVVDSTGATGCTFPTIWAVGYTNQPSPGCTYNRTAPNVPVDQSSVDYPNVLTVDCDRDQPRSRTPTPSRSSRRRPNWKVDVFVSPFALGGDGDGNGGKVDFGNQVKSDQGVNAIITNESVWFQIIAQNVGGSTATGVSISSTLGPCLTARTTHECRLRRGADDAGANGHVHLPLQGRCRPARHDPEHGDRTSARNAVPTGRSNVATATVTTCANPNRVDSQSDWPSEGAAQTAWTSGGLPGGGLSAWNGNGDSP